MSMQIKTYSNRPREIGRFGNCSLSGEVEDLRTDPIKQH